MKRLAELNSELDMDKREGELVDEEKDGDEAPKESTEEEQEENRDERETSCDREGR